MIRNIRLASGLALFAYVTTHLLNHTLGLVSLEAMERGRVWFLLIWRNPLGTLLLYGALTVHFALAVGAVYERRRLAMRLSEIIQLAFGISIPLLLASHAAGTRMAHEIAGTNDSYAYVLLAHWKFSPKYIAYQTAGLLAAWVHGCIGIHYWLRLKPWYAGVRQVLYAAALLTPVLALLGYAQAGRETLALSADPEWMRQASAAIRWPDRAAIGTIENIADTVWIAVFSGFALALIARHVRSVLEKRRGTITLTYHDGRAVTSRPGNSILDTSHHFQIPHASVCGGRGRCSTCRVRIIEGFGALPPPSTEEQHVLDRIGNPSNVRLACQTRPHQDVSLVLLLPPNASPRDARARDARHNGQEMEIAVLFSDLRSFTKFSEKKLPYDVVFVLNRYFAEMGEAIETSGGQLDKFIGDGVMALFGIDTDINEACRQALRAAQAMASNLERLNQTLSSELDEPLRLGIGIHAGHAIVGEMGYGRASHVTAIGDTVNTASRLESMNKELQSQLVVSADVGKYAGVNLSGFPSQDIDVRGRRDAVHIHVIADAKELPLGPA
ncbi:MAG TPA: adenylate/guanylate cyclase domain-containing protein [Nitrospinae bacterium]|nr:adenylate/guanylate cyclase domain-containing protein [Nitrospinota bacterium]